MAGDRSVAALLGTRPALLLDGSMGQELQRRGVADDPLVWTAHAMEGNARIVQALHEAYIHAGADIITTNSYATNLRRFERAGGRTRFERLNHLAGQLAVQAVQAAGLDTLVAASIGPLRESYRPDQVIGFAQMCDEYAPQIAILAGYADVFLCETLSTVSEGRAAATAALLEAGDRPVWVSWTLRDDRPACLRSGETLAAAIDALADLPVSGYLVNCSLPETLVAALPELARHEATVIGAYANGFSASCDHWQPTAGGPAARADLDPGRYAGFARTWLELGANLIGGCCDVGPAHIERLHQLIIHWPGTKGAARRR